MYAPKFEWNHPPEFLILDYDEVHVWRATLDLPPSDVQALEQILAADERLLSVKRVATHCFST